MRDRPTMNLPDYVSCPIAMICTMFAHVVLARYEHTRGWQIPSAHVSQRCVICTQLEILCQQCLPILRSKLVQPMCSKRRAYRVSLVPAMPLWILNCQGR